MVPAYSAFRQRKLRLLASLGDGLEESDRSLKKSVDTPLLPVINLLNEESSLVTTSCCSGRVSIFWDPVGRRAGEGGKQTKRGGKLIYVSHERIADVRSTAAMIMDMLRMKIISNTNAAPASAGSDFYSLERGVDSTVIGDIKSSLQPARLPAVLMTPTSEVYLRFEPLVVHTECANIHSANRLLNISVHDAGLKNSGIMSLPIASLSPRSKKSSKRTGEGDAPRCVLAIRGTQRLETPLVVDGEVWVTVDHLTRLLLTCNTKMDANQMQISRLENCLRRCVGTYDSAPLQNDVLSSSSMSLSSKPEIINCSQTPPPQLTQLQTSSAPSSVCVVSEMTSQGLPLGSRSLRLWGASVAVLSDWVVVFGGFGGPTQAARQSALWVFITSSNRWVSPSFRAPNCVGPSPRQGSHLLPAGPNKAVLMGGRQGPHAPCVDVWILTLEESRGKRANCEIEGEISSEIVATWETANVEDTTQPTAEHTTATQNHGPSRLCRPSAHRSAACVVECYNGTVLIAIHGGVRTYQANSDSRGDQDTRNEVELRSFDRNGAHKRWLTEVVGNLFSVKLSLKGQPKTPPSVTLPPSPSPKDWKSASVVHSRWRCHTDQSPGPIHSHSLTKISSAGCPLMVVVGGVSDLSGRSPHTLADSIHAISARDWTWFRIPVASPLVQSPCPRFSHTACYLPPKDDLTHGGVFVFGGCTGRGVVQPHNAWLLRPVFGHVRSENERETRDSLKYPEDQPIQFKWDAVPLHFPCESGQRPSTEGYPVVRLGMRSRAVHVESDDSIYIIGGGAVCFTFGSHFDESLKCQLRYQNNRNANRTPGGLSPDCAQLTDACRETEGATALQISLTHKQLNEAINDEVDIHRTHCKRDSLVTLGNTAGDSSFYVGTRGCRGRMKAIKLKLEEMDVFHRKRKILKDVNRDELEEFSTSNGKHRDHIVVVDRSVLRYDLFPIRKMVDFAYLIECVRELVGKNPERGQPRVDKVHSNEDQGVNEGETSRKSLPSEPDESALCSGGTQPSATNELGDNIKIFRFTQTRIRSHLLPVVRESQDSILLNRWATLLISRSLPAEHTEATRLAAACASRVKALRLSAPIASSNSVPLKSSEPDRTIHPKMKYERLGDIILFCPRWVELVTTTLCSVCGCREKGQSDQDENPVCPRCLSASHFLWEGLAGACRAKVVGVQRPIEGEKRQSKVTLLYPTVSHEGLLDDPEVKQHQICRHVENGVVFQFDVTRLMFSSGNGTERMRICKLVEHSPLTNDVGSNDVEMVLDMFCGIGYFSLPILVHSERVRVIACDWNREALEAFRSELALNRINFLEDRFRLTLIQGDSTQLKPWRSTWSALHPTGRSWVEGDIGFASHILRIEDVRGVPYVDRVLLGLIPSSEHAWRTACGMINPLRGGFLHIHEVAHVKEAGSTKHLPAKADYIEAKIQEFFDIDVGCAATCNEGCEPASKLVWRVSVQHVEKVKPYAPLRFHFVFDVECRLYCSSCCEIVRREESTPIV
eukprot:GHVN01019106.1.p1 GENE.GHVN01019106.1~~GHVN01019106.1.p1  ORF type:complete len:1502 (+),score=149.35 GHVN01019106.1:396-4901(+)